MSLERSESWGDLGLFLGEGQGGTNLGENPSTCVGRRDREKAVGGVPEQRGPWGESRSFLSRERTAGFSHVP